MSESESITQAQYEGLKKQINDIAKTIDVKFAEWSDDRKTITDVLVRLKTVEAKVDGARDDIADGNKKLINRVDEHLEPIPEMMATQVKTELNKKSMIDKLKEKIG
jgi:hypothetical protein